jgi:hypothetical protein
MPDGSKRKSHTGQRAPMQASVSHAGQRVPCRPPARDGPTIDDSFSGFAIRLCIVGPSLAGGLRGGAGLGEDVQNTVCAMPLILAGGLRGGAGLRPGPTDRPEGG